MKQSQLFTKTEKNAPKDEQSVNANLLIRAGYIEKLMAGVYTILPLGLCVIRKIESIIREEMDRMGGQEIFMPSLHPKENWEKTGRWATVDDLFKVKDASDREFALGPTHEEVVVPLMKRFIQSYKDLPVYVYQFQNKFRMELRAKSGVLRGKEFIMKDFYSFHLNEEDLEQYYEKMSQAYFNIFIRCGIGGETHLTYASGGSFSNYSHEFQTLTEAGEDIIHICTKCGLAINREIKAEVELCPGCKNNEFKEEKSVEVGNIFKLKTKYSAPFDLEITTEKGENQTVLMGCYGIGLQRLMGTVVEVHHDEQGIIWPESIAPFKVHILSLGKDADAEKLYNQLVEHDIEVMLDDRDVSAGQKLADADLLGIPWRIVISEKSLQAGGVEVKKRSEKDSQIVPVKEISEFINSKA